MMRAPRKQVLVIGVGNTARGDDGLAPALLKRLRASVHAQDGWLNLVEDAQFNIEHALDMQLNDLTLFLDASVDAPAPFRFSEIIPSPQRRAVPMSHALEPLDVLHTFSTISRRPPPSCFLLALHGEHFELGIGLSQAAARHLEAASGFLEKLLDTPDAEAWRALVQGAPGGS